MAREILDNGQIKLSDERIINPLYWDEESTGWKEYDLDKLDLSSADKTWIGNNLTDAHKDKYKEAFGAPKL